MEVFSFTNDDLGDIMEISRRMHAESPNYRDLPFDHIAVGAWAAMHIRADNMAAWGVRSPRDELIGGMFARIEPTYFGPATVAIEDALYVAPNYRGSRAAHRLLGAFAFWAKENNVDRMVVTPSTGINEDRACGFLEKLGFHKAATSMVKDLG